MKLSRLDTISSVSYTHLDVYKRQAAIDAIEAADGGLLFPEDVPVSYTHLKHI